jgi:chromosome segregation ATPase
MDRALAAWDAQHVKQVADLEQGIAAATRAGQDARVKELQAQLQALRGQRGSLVDDLNGEVLAVLNEQDRAAWYALDLHDLALAYADIAGVRVSHRDEWQIVDAARARGQELARVQDKAALRQATAAARDAIMDTLPGAAAGPASSSEVATRKGQAADQARPGGKGGAGQGQGTASPSAREQQLEKDNASLQRQIDRLKGTLANLKAQVDSLTAEVQKLQDDLTALMKELEACKNKIRAG